MRSGRGRGGPLARTGTSRVFILGSCELVLTVSCRRRSIRQRPSRPSISQSSAHGARLLPLPPPSSHPTSASSPHHLTRTTTKTGSGLSSSTGRSAATSPPLTPSSRRARSQVPSRPRQPPSSRPSPPPSSPLLPLSAKFQSTTPYGYRMRSVTWRTRWVRSLSRTSEGYRWRWRGSRRTTRC